MAAKRPGSAIDQRHGAPQALGPSDFSSAAWLVLRVISVSRCSCFRLAGVARAFSLVVLWCSLGFNLSYSAPNPFEPSCSPRLVFSTLAALKGFVPTPEPSSAPALRASTATAVAAASTALPAGAADEYLNYNMTGQG